MAKDEGHTVSRRGFLKKAALGTLAFSSVPALIGSRRAEAYEPGAEIHPNISPLRVVGLRDPRMTTRQSLNTDWSVRDPMVATQVVHDNMDRLAMALVQENRAADAWKGVFLKPAGKSWSDVVVAIKTNQIAQQRTRSAVMSKICHVLTETMGVSASNIHIYDACHGRSMSGNPWVGLPEGVHQASRWGGYNVKTKVPAPYFGGQRTSECLDRLVQGKVDILVNVALCKGHGGQFGGFTMSMKNHFGTFNPRPSHGAGGGADYLIGINKAPEILGSIDPKTGNVLFPRQQLCIIDALWASEPGPGGLPTHQPNAILMGTFNPVLDYVAAMRLRKDMMGWRVNENVAKRFLSEFGVKEGELPNGGRIVDAAQWPA
ncbi:MAG: DUF362 domain-containing protein [Candidatus Brocadiaceae bacterium]|jgi:hypothetical protein